MIKELQYKGYATEPSDYECPDGQLATSLNLINEDGQLKPVFQPAEKFSLLSGEKLLWIHRMTGHTHYILLYTTTVGGTTTQILKWTCEQDDVSTSGMPPVETRERHTIDGFTVTGTPTVNSIGNTLIVNDDTGINYFLWSTEGTAHYEALGQKPPMLNIVFGLHSDFAVWPETKNTGTTPGGFKGTEINVGRINDSGYFPKLGTESGDLSAAWVYPQPEMAAHQGSDPVDERIRDFANVYATFSVEGKDSTTESLEDDMLTIKNKLSNGVFAAINRFVNEKGTEKNKFVMPFFVRYAYRLYDDSYIMHSYPVLMIPNSRGPIFGLDGRSGMLLADYNGSTIGFKMRGRAYGFLSKLVYSVMQVESDLEKWKDIITSVDIGVSAPIWTYDQAGYVYGWTNMDDSDSWDEFYSISKVTQYAGVDATSPVWPSNGIAPFKGVFETFDSSQDYFARYSNNYKYPSYIATVPQRSISDINNDLTGATNFYIIKQLTLDEITTCDEAELKLDDGTLGGLLGRSRIADDYHTHDTLKASLMYNYNGRMNYAGIERTPHSPIIPSIQFPQANALPGSTQWQISVSIKNGAETLTVQSDPGTSNIEFPRFIFYPDRNAKYAYVTKGSTNYKLKLTPHDFLNGAYWLGNIMSQTAAPTTYSGTIPTATTTGFNEENKLYTSNVNNPFFFEVENIKNIGYGKILGLRSAAKALSPSQFGQFPLYAFTTEGVWALGVTDTGTFKPSQPFTEDVCINPDSITQLDSTVLFATARGIMHVSGSEAQCISDNIFAEHPFDVTDLPGINVLHEQMGHSADACVPVKPFLGFLAGCQMIYDYIHQRIIVFNPSTTTINGVTTQNYSYAYVFSLKSKMWGMMYSNLDYSVNSYPDSLAVDKAGKLVSFSDTDEEVCKGLYITRPLKLEAADVHKTISALIQRGHFQRGDVGTVLYGSRDLYTWHLIWSSKDQYLRGFRGTPYKYFRIAGLTALTDGKSVFGASVNFEPRHTNNLR